jgi:hypothetical protein
MSYAVIRSGLGQGGPGGTTGAPKTQADYDREKAQANYAKAMYASLPAPFQPPVPEPQPPPVNVTVTAATPAQQAALDAQFQAQRVAKPSELQLILGVPITGTYDAATRSAVQAFQTVHGLPPTGEPDAATANLLISIIGKNPKACPVPGDVRVGDLCMADMSEAKLPPTMQQRCEHGDPTLKMGDCDFMLIPPRGTKQLVSTPGGLMAWWAAQSTMMKAVVVGGGAIAVLGVLSLVGGGSKSMTPNRRRKGR